MSTNTFITSRVTTQSSLAAVAYGSSLFFHFVQDQIRGSHSMYDLHRSRASSNLVDMLGSKEIFEDFVEKIIENTADYNLLSKIYPEKIKTPRDFSVLFVETFLRELDSYTKYSVNLAEFLEYVLNSVVMAVSGEKQSLADITGDILSHFFTRIKEENTDIKKLETILTVVLDNPNGKIEDVPNDRLLKLRRGLSTEYNHKGLTKARVEIPIQQWNDNFVYRDMKTFQDASAKFFIIENYDGYGIETLLDPEIANGPTTQSIPLEEGSAAYNFPATNPKRLKPGEERIINFDLINAQPGIVEV